jgi:hypothetical protein
MGQVPSAWEGGVGCVVVGTEKKIYFKEKGEGKTNDDIGQEKMQEVPISNNNDDAVVGAVGV